MSGDWGPLCSRMVDDWARLAEWCIRLDELLLACADELLLAQPKGSEAGLRCEQALRTACRLLSLPCEVEALRGGGRIGACDEPGPRWLREQNDVLLRTTDDREWWKDLLERVSEHARTGAEPETLCDQIDRERANLTTDSAPATGDGATIPPEFRTRPISYKRAARCLGKGNSKEAAEWVSACVEDGTLTCEHCSRQMHVFDLREFPKDAWPQLAATGGK